MATASNIGTVVQNIRFRHLGPLAHFRGYRGSFERVKRPGRVVNNSPSSSVKVKKSGAIFMLHYAPSWRLDGKHNTFSRPLCSYFYSI